MQESRLAPEFEPLLQDTVVERDIFSFRCILSEFIWSEVIASLLDDFLGIVVACSVSVASLEEREAAEEVRPPASGTAARMKTAPERSLPMNKSLLFLHRESVSGGRIGSRIFCIFSRSKHRDVKKIHIFYLPDIMT